MNPNSPVFNMNSNSTNAVTSTKKPYSKKGRVSDHPLPPVQLPLTSYQKAMVISPSSVHAQNTSYLKGPIENILTLYKYANQSRNILSFQTLIEQLTDDELSSIFKDHYYGTKISFSNNFQINNGNFIQWLQGKLPGSYASRNAVKSWLRNELLLSSLKNNSSDDNNNNNNNNNDHSSQDQDLSPNSDDQSRIQEDAFPKISLADLTLSAPFSDIMTKNGATEDVLGLINLFSEKQLQGIMAENFCGSVRRFCEKYSLPKGIFKSWLRGKTTSKGCRESSRLFLLEHFSEKQEQESSSERKEYEPILSPQMLFIFASKSGNLANVVDFVEKNKISLNVQDGIRRTPLVWACLSGHENVATYLIEKGADVNSRDSSYITPLIAACRAKIFNAVKLLLEKGADRNAKDSTGNTGLLWACQKDHLETVKILCQHPPFLTKDSSVKSNNNTAQSENTWRPPEIDAVGSSGNAALHWACTNQSFEVCKELIRAGANVNQRGESKKTPLLITAKSNVLEICQLFLENGANANDQDLQGISPLWWAFENENRELIDLLLPKTDTLILKKMLDTVSDDSKLIKSLHFEIEQRSLSKKLSPTELFCDPPSYSLSFFKKTLNDMQVNHYGQGEEDEDIVQKIKELSQNQLHFLFTNANLFPSAATFCNIYKLNFEKFSAWIERRGNIRRELYALRQYLLDIEQFLRKEEKRRRAKVSLEEEEEKGGSSLIKQMTKLQLGGDMNKLQLSAVPTTDLVGLKYQDFGQIVQKIVQQKSSLKEIHLIDADNSNTSLIIDKIFYEMIQKHKALKEGKHIALFFCQKDSFLPQLWGLDHRDSIFLTQTSTNVKDAADTRIIFMASLLHCQLPHHIRFRVITNDHFSKELEQIFKASGLSNRDVFFNLNKDFV